MQVSLIYVFKGFESRNDQRCALLEFNGLLKGKPGREAASPNLRMSVDEGSTSGKSWFDPDIGIVIASEIEQDMKMQLEIGMPQSPGSNAPSPAAPRSMTTQIRQQIQLSLHPEAPASSTNAPKPRLPLDRSGAGQ
jgi:hypothetical protein